MNRIRLLLFTAFVMVVTAFSSGISVSYADQAPADAKQTDEQQAAAAKKKADDAARAIAKKAEMLKQRKAAREFMKKSAEGQQPGAETAAPDNAGAGGAK